MHRRDEAPNRRLAAADERVAEYLALSVVIMAFAAFRGGGSYPNDRFGRRKRHDHENLSSRAAFADPDALSQFGCQTEAGRLDF